MTLVEAPDLTQLLHDQMPYASTLAVAAVAADADGVVVTAGWRPEYCGLGGVLHGGYLMSLADASGATLAFLNLQPGSSTTTVESKTNFFRPVTAGSVTATSTMVHKGRTTMVVQTDIANDEGALVSRTLQTQAVRRAEHRAAR